MKKTPSTLGKKMPSTTSTTTGKKPSSSSAGGNAVKVYARIRPLKDIKKDPLSALQVTGNYISERRKGDSALSKGPEIPEKGFEFEMCFDNSQQNKSGDKDLIQEAGIEGQREVFRHLGPPMLEAALSGYNTCLMAYGQTGSGKTHTMIGHPPQSKKKGEERGNTDQGEGGEDLIEEQQSTGTRFHEGSGFVPKFVQNLFHRIKKTQSRETTHRVPRPPSTLGGLPVSQFSDPHSADLLPTEQVFSSSTTIRSTPSSTATEAMPYNVVPKNCSVKFMVHVRYFEIYNEKCYDLLAAPDLESSNGKKKGGSSSATSDAGSMPSNVERKVVEVRDNEEMPGLSEHWVTSPERVLELLQLGDRQRSIGSTKKNDRSSRSHAVFQLKVTKHICPLDKKDLAASTSTNGEATSQPERQEEEISKPLTVVSKVSLVDLAGSERQKESGAEGDRFKEMTNINLSLSTLRKVIQQLQAGDRHLSIRESLLTRALSNCFGGNSKTSLLINLSPDPEDFKESKSSLLFSSDAKKVVNKAHVNVDQTTKALQAMNDEIAKLKERLEKEADARAAAQDALGRARQEADEVRGELMQTQSMVLTQTTPRPDEPNMENRCIGTSDDPLRDSKVEELEAQLSTYQEQERLQLQTLSSLQGALEIQQKEKHEEIEQMTLALQDKDEEIAGVRKELQVIQRGFKVEIKKYIREKTKLEKTMTKVKEPLTKQPGCAACQSTQTELTITREQNVQFGCQVERLETSLKSVCVDHEKLQSKVEALEQANKTLTDEIKVHEDLKKVLVERDRIITSLEDHMKTELEKRVDLFMQKSAYEQAARSQQQQLTVVASSQSAKDNSTMDDSSSPPHASSSSMVVDISELGFSSVDAFKSWFDIAKKNST